MRDDRSIRRRVGVLLTGARAALPIGGNLPAADWQHRHRSLVAFLWLNVAAVLVLSAAGGDVATPHLLEHAAIVPLVLVASASRLSRKVRSLAVVLGLMTAAALFVHMSGGVTETHFYFFVLVGLLTLYEDWVVFLVTVGYVLLHHGIVGMVDPHAVFENPAAWSNPWTWAGIHAVYIAGAGTAGVVAWSLNEKVRARMLAAQTQLSTISHTDSLTGLGNRRKLMTDLQAAVEAARPTVLVVLDLDGFKSYNDTFGHGAGDALLARLGQRLGDSLGRHGTAYRPGGDEFCVIAPAASDTAASLEALAVQALSEHCDLFSVSCSSGTVLLGAEVHSVADALHLADQRMYAQKSGGRTGAGGQAKDVLLATLTERSPDLGRHTNGVAELSELVAEQLDLPQDERITIRQAAELHDIGKMGVPDAILDKPGPLSAQEWKFMYQHPIIGQRIVSAAPALVGAGELIRSSHEHFDGSGYPDGLSGEHIPIGARIVTVCDAFDAMVSDRPYRPARSPREALAELQRCAGTQFDPAIVAAFAAATAAGAPAEGAAARRSGGARARDGAADPAGAGGPADSMRRHVP